MKSPTKRLPSIPTARATGANSLLPSARPLQLGQEMLLRRPLPMMLVMMAGCWVRNWFSPVPLCSIPGDGGREKGGVTQPCGEDTWIDLLEWVGSDREKRNHLLWGVLSFSHNIERTDMGDPLPKLSDVDSILAVEITEDQNKNKSKPSNQ